ncbi:preprotein translocase subunit YajC [Peterkaempfera bronchialis]|uniref:Preprotein translocase subunit YajC n=1 Tax=Peterkaempfera bronchialis TaxID=2126346 RepID=A0A345T6X5_9ACTN|nr:preprotein translocase subunit YajC [Peterkaempfera bronchialis]
MFIMTRNAKKKQQQALEMRNNMGPGSGVRTIGGMYALVKSVNDDTVELEAAPGIFLHFTKSAIAAVLEPEEYEAIVNGVPASDDEVPPFVEEDGVVEAEAEAAPKSLDLSKPEAETSEAAASEVDTSTTAGEKVSEGVKDEGPAAK